MGKIQRTLCALVALCVMSSGVGAHCEAATAQTDGYTAYTHNARVTLIDGACTDARVDSFEDAAQVVDSVFDRLGGDENTQLDPWREITDTFGNRYFVFQQMYDNTTVLGGAVKVVTDPEGRMLGLTSSIEANPAETEPSEGIEADEAERIVLDYALSTRQQTLAVVEELTERMILPIALEVDIDAEDDEGSRYVWVVYTDNPDSSMTYASDLPYLAHYVTMDGTYLYSLPTIRPGDAAGASGFDASYVFEFMESVNYTGYVDLSTGEEMELSVDVMRDKRTGMYYLGNLERRIVVADCWEFLYGGNRVVLESSPDNLEWDQVGLLTLYNYCRAYDYYREIGWVGGDGLGTPIMVLNNYCDINRVPVDNAAYVGGYLGWQIFLASQGNDLSQCLDVLAHEFTHCVTGSVMTYNAYKNDYGAINEAMSDIQGKTCQMLMEGREDVSWFLGDRCKQQFRSMDDPHRYNQPEFTWDIYYVPNAKTPTVLNDLGGVHTNSSLLNALAYQLYAKGGMTLEEGRAFWFTVDCAMVPGTDYAQLSEILPWALRLTGLEQYDAELRRALDATRMGTEALPDTFDEDRALLTLSLPENEIFDDEQWIMMLYSVNINKLVAEVMNIAFHVMNGNYSDLPPFVQDILAVLDSQEVPEEAQEGAPEADATTPSLLDALLEAFFPEDDAQSGPVEDLPYSLEEIERQLKDWLSGRMKGVFYAANTNAGQDGCTMRMMVIPGHALPILLHAVYNEKTSELEDTRILVLFGGHWLDVSAIIEEGKALLAMDEDEIENLTLSTELEPLLTYLAENIDSIHGVMDALDLILYPVEGGKQNALPTEGLDTATPGTIDLSGMTDTASETPEPRKSRPKLESEAVADGEAEDVEAEDVEAEDLGAAA